MTALRYPVAETAEAALREPRGLAVREAEARALAAGPVAFVVEPAGPAFASREAAQAAYVQAAGAIGAGLASGWAQLRPVAAAAACETGRPGGAGTGGRLTPVKPVYAKGRRWPRPPAAPPPQWRIWVSYWRIGVRDAVSSPLPPDPARHLRRTAQGRGLDPAALSALARQPLRPVKPQQPLEIGLFEARRPEAPDLIIPDE